MDISSTEELFYMYVHAYTAIKSFISKHVFQVTHVLWELVSPDTWYNENEGIES